MFDSDAVVFRRPNTSNTTLTRCRFYLENCYSFLFCVAPVSLKLKNNIRTYKSDCIVQKAEKSLLNERIRNINSILDDYEHDRYMYTKKLPAILGPDITKECEKFIEGLKEARNLKVME